MDLNGVSRGSVIRVSGPLIEATTPANVAISEVVNVGPDRIPAEVVAIADGTVTLQAYDYTGGVCVGHAVVPSGFPLSARLGPGLLGQVFDGLLRRLTGAPVWLSPSGTFEHTARSWEFEPAGSAGEPVRPGEVLGTVTMPGAGALEHRVVVPPGIRGEIVELAGSGPVAEDQDIATIGKHPVRLYEHWPIRRSRPIDHRVDDVLPLHTGQRVLDLMFPIARGATAAVPGGFGTGKTVLLQQIAKWCDADVIVYVGCGERGNEMADVLAELSELVDPRTGGRLVDRTVILANTSNMPMMAREASIYTAITVAEYYRDMGYDAVVIADSTSRWAEALREFASRTGALPAEEGYPADLASALAAFYERAGRVRTLGGRIASVTAIGAVSPPGGDLTEPVTTHTERFVQAVWSLDRDLAYSRHYPSVSWPASYSRQMEAVGEWYAGNGDPGWSVRRARAGELLSEAARLRELAEIVGANALPGRERMVMLSARLLEEAVLMQSALSDRDASCGSEKAAALLQLVLDVADQCLRLVEHGVPPALVEEFDFGQLVRLRDDAGPADLELIRATGSQLAARLAELTESRLA